MTHPSHPTHPSPAPTPSPPPPQQLLAGQGGGFRPGAFAGAVVGAGDGGGRRVLPRIVPTLTVYANGYVQPNAEGAALLSAYAPGLCFHAPPAPRASRPARPWQVSAGRCHLFVPHESKPGQLRLSAAGECPPEGRYLLAPVAGQPTRFTLLPL